MNKYVLVFATALSLLLTACTPDTEDPDADLNRDIRVIDAYLQSTGVPSSKILSGGRSGIRFVFDSYGKGIAATQGQTVEYDVIGSVLSNGAPGAPFINGQETKKLDDVTPEGLRFALASILQGTDVTVYIPARFGYGTNGNAALGIPADAVLKYDILVKKVNRTLAQKTQFEQDIAAIKDFLAANNIVDAVEHESGIFYRVEEEGVGEVPNPYQAVTFDYELRTLANAGGSALQANTLTNFSIWELVQGLRIGLQLMNEGATYTFYLPSGMCYGTSTQGNIPANSNLIFKIKLKANPG